MPVWHWISRAPGSFQNDIPSPFQLVRILALSAMSLVLESHMGFHVSAFPTHRPKVN